MPLTPVFVDTYGGEVKREVLEIAGCHKKQEDTLLKDFMGSDFLIGHNFKRYSCVQGEDVKDGTETLTGDLYLKMVPRIAATTATNRTLFCVLEMDGKLVFSNGSLLAIQ